MLVTPSVRLLDTMKNRFTEPDDVMERLGVNADRVIDFLSLTGDKVDNINTGIARNEERYKGHEKRIDKNEADIKKVGSLNAAVALISSTLAGIIGSNR